MKPAMAALHGDSSTRAALRELAMRAADDGEPLMGAETHRRLALWNGLLAGRWVLVDRFETEGRRHFVLAEAAREAGADAASLGSQERQLITLVAAGFSDKAMAVTLGIAPSTLSGVLKRTLAKLGFRSRVELVRLLRALAVDANT